MEARTQTFAFLMKILPAPALLTISCLVILLSSSVFASSFAQSSSSSVTMKKCVDCWSGYTDSSKTGGVTAVYMSFINPFTVSCPSNGNVYYVFVGAAIDGSSSKDFAAAGVIITCGGPQHVQDFAPVICFATMFCQFEVGSPYGPGDTIYVSLVATGGNFVGNVTDHDATGSFIKSSSDAGAKLNMGSCLTDMFTGSGMEGGFGNLALPSSKGGAQPTFSVVEIGSKYTKEFPGPNSCDTTIKSATKPIGSQSGVTIIKWTAYSTKGKALTSVTSLASDNSFKVTEKATGP
jgi:hypothetical protein